MINLNVQGRKLKRSNKFKASFKIFSYVQFLMNTTNVQIAF